MGRDVEAFRYEEHPDVLAAKGPEARQKVRARAKERVRLGKGTGPWDGEALGWAYENGMSIKQLHCERHSPTARKLARWVSRALGHAVRLNLYVTPAHEQGFEMHFDTDDVFILQTHGEKLWEIFKEATPLPLTDWGETELRRVRHKVGTPTLRTILRPGEALYIPRGWLHHAHTNATTHNGVRMSGASGSVHITLGVLHVYWADVLMDSLALITGQTLTGKLYPKMVRLIAELAEALTRKGKLMRTSLPYQWLQLPPSREVQEGFKTVATNFVKQAPDTAIVAMCKQIGIPGGTVGALRKALDTKLGSVNSLVQVVEYRRAWMNSTDDWAAERFRQQYRPIGFFVLQKRLRDQSRQAKLLGEFKVGKTK